MAFPMQAPYFLPVCGCQCNVHASSLKIKTSWFVGTKASARRSPGYRHATTLHWLVPTKSLNETCIIQGGRELVSFILVGAYMYLKERSQAWVVPIERKMKDQALGRRDR